MTKLRIGLSSLFLTTIFSFIACSNDSSSSEPGSSESNENGSSSSGELSDVSQMGCTEIMYNHETSALEWVEITIASGKDLNSMAAYSLRLSGAVDYTFPDEPLKKGEYIVVANDLDLFKETYPDFSGRLFGPWEKDEKTGEIARLSNSGDIVSVKIQGAGDVDCAFDNDPPWPSLADGKGSSLVLIGDKPTLAESWGASKQVNGNPGSALDSVYEPLTIRINEVNPTDGTDDWIELYNASSKDKDISGWRLIAKKRGDTLTIPEGTVVKGNAYTVLTANELPDLLLLTRGENLYLREYVNGTWTYSETGFEYPASPGKTAGVLELSDGSLIQASLSKATKGNANESSVAMGPLYINEIHYNPAENTIPEFLEIINKADTAVSLSATVNGKSGVLEISGIGTVDLTNVTLEPEGILLLISKQEMEALGIDEDKFIESLGLSENVVVRTFSGKLSNRGEKIVLKQPYTWTQEIAGGVVDWYYRWSDVVQYSDDGYWPQDADGVGMSLNRTDFTLPGSDPRAFDARMPTPGK